MKFLLSMVFVLFLSLITGCSQIDSGNTGVESVMGQVKKETLPSGVYFTLFKRVYEVSAKELPISMSDMKPATSDKINLSDLDVDIYVQIDPSKASEIMTRWPGDILDVKGEDGLRVGFNYVTRQAREAIYNTVSKFKSDTVHTERNAISDGILKSLQAELDSSAGKGWFFIRSVNVRNLVTDPALEVAIKEAANRQFQINAKVKELELTKLEADRKRAEAAGDADAIKLRAAAVTSQGGAEYVQLQAINKWDGHLPTTMVAGSNGHILNLPVVTK